MGQYLLALLAGLFQGLTFLLPLGTQYAQTFQLLVQGLTDLLQLANGVVEIGDADGAGLVEVVVIGHHPPHGGGVFLIEQDLDGFLAPHGVGGAHLSGQVFTLSIQAAA